MYSKTKRAFCLILAVLCLSFCVLPGAAPKAEASNPALALTAVKWILGLAGITFASAGVAYVASNSFYNSDNEVAQAFDDFASNFLITDGNGRINVIWNALTVRRIATLVMLAKSYFSQEKTEIQAPTDKVSVCDIVALNYDGFVSLRSSPASLFAFANFTTELVPTLALNGVDYNYSIYSYSTSGDYVYQLRKNGDVVYYSYRTQYTSGSLPCAITIANSSNYSSMTPKFGFHLSEDANTLVPFLVVQAINANTGELSYFASCLNEPCNFTNYGYPLDAETLEDVKVNIPYEYYAQTITDKLSSIEALLNTLTDTANPPTTDISDWNDTEGIGEKDTAHNVPYMPSWEIAQLRDMIKDLLDSIKAKQEAEGIDDALTNEKINALLDEMIKEKTQTENPTDEKDDEDPDIPQLPDLRDKFPFCVPFDLIACFSALNAEPEAPRFVVPFEFAPLDFKYDIVIDFAPFERIAEVCRWVCTFSFIVFLALVTRKIIQA